MAKRVPAGEKEHRRVCGRWLWSGIAELYFVQISDDRVACYSEEYDKYLIRSVL